jgi:hypothetical protein
MVAWQELPGIGTATDPSSRTRYEGVQLTLVTARMQLTVRPLSDRSLGAGTIGKRFPGSSCQATIIQSLRDNLLRRDPPNRSPLGCEFR